jgi:hypothetical protein
LDNFVLQNIFTDLNGCQTLDKADMADDDDKEIDAFLSDKKEQCFLWLVAFKCFGPMAMDVYKLQLIALEDIKGGKTKEREIVRAMP